MKTLERARSWSVCIFMVCAILALGCATSVEQAAIAQRDEWLRHRERMPTPPALPAEPELSDFEHLALYTSPELQVAYARWRSQVGRIALARTLPDPTIGFGIFAQEVETAVGPQQARFGFEQRIPWLSKLILAGDAQALAARAAFAEAAAIRLDLRQRVRSLWGELYYLGRRIEITRDNVELVRQWGQSARARYRSSLLLYRDVARAQIELETLEDELARLGEQRSPLAVRLLSLVGLEPGTPVPLPESLPERQPLASDEELGALLRARNPELVALRHRVDLAEVDVDLARTRYWPDLRVGLAYTLTGEARMPDVPDSGKDAILPQVGLSVPIWWGSYGGAVDSAAEGRKAANQQLRARRLALDADLADALFRLNDAERRLTLYRDEILPLARETLESTTAAYRSGRVELLDLIDAQRTLLEFSLAAERARTDGFVADARVRALVGAN